VSFWETVIVGESVDLGAHTFAADEIKRFAAQYDPQIFHLDEEKAKASVLGGLCASGWHTAAVCMRLNIETRNRRLREWAAAGRPAPRFGPSPGVKNLRWLKPVYAGDTITFHQTVTAKRPTASRPGWGVVEFITQGTNQAGETVFSFEGAVFLGLD